jgi:hypothetical protein
MFIASTLIGFTVMERYPAMKVLARHPSHSEDRCGLWTWRLPIGGAGPGTVSVTIFPPFDTSPGVEPIYPVPPKISRFGVQNSRLGRSNFPVLLNRGICTAGL